LLGQLLAQQRQVVLFDRRRRERGVRVEEPRELGYCAIALDDPWLAPAAPLHVEGKRAQRTFSNISLSFASVSLSWSVGFGGILDAVESCEYV